MRNIYLHSSAKQIRLGSALVWFLIFVVVVIVVAVAQKVMKEKVKNPDTCLDLEPWKEWRLRESNPKPLQGPSEKQPDITKGVRYDVNVNYQDEARGQLYLEIQPDGIVRGAWNGHYDKEKSKLSYDIQAGGFEGYVCPLKIYRDENGEDQSKLYFIAKGDFLIHEYDLKSKYHIITGALYVTGWIDADYAVRGNIVITSDEKYSETYDWKAFQHVEK